MKTKYILHGGFTPGQNIDDSFYKEILEDAPQKPKILLVYFAKEEDRVAKNREEDIEQFNKNRGKRILKFDTADRDLFIKQVMDADVVYLHGGHSGKLLEALKEFPDLKKVFGGKIVAGDSAGANVLVEVFYSKSIGVTEGLGMLPIKLISHFLEENKDKLNNIKQNLELVFLPEYETKVIYG